MNISTLKKNRFTFLTTCLTLFAFLFVVNVGWGQTTMFQFDFETGTAPSIDNVTGTPAFSTVGTLTSSTGVCNGSGSITYSAWDLNDAYRFQVNTTAFSNLVFSYVERTSNVTISTFLVRVSTDLSSWTTVRASYTPTTSCASSGSISIPSTFSNQSTVYIEIYKNVNAGNSGNTYRIDDVTLTGTAQATSITAGTPTSSSIPTISCTNGTGAKRAIFMAAASTGSAAPVNSTTYTANTVFGSGTQIGSTGWYCVFNGTGTPSVNVTGLSSSTTYRVMVCEYDGNAGAEVYNTYASGTGNPANFTTTSGSGPSLAITGTTAHGSVCPNNAATPITYTITNTGPVQADGINVSSNDAQFVVSGLSNTSISASGGTVTYNVTFTPTSAGAKSATITVTSTTSGSNSPTSSLTGTGTATVAQAVTSSAASSVSYYSSTLNGNVTTLGVCPATIEKGFVYSLTSTNANPQVSGTGVTKTVVAGVATGAYTLGLTGLTSNAGYSFKAYVYDGTTYTYGSVTTFTTSAALAISGTTSHGSVCPNVAATPITYTITNNGAVQADGINVVSSDPQFVVSGLSNTSITASGGTVTYQVTFTPTSAGSKTSTITVTSSTSGLNAPTSSLTGTGNTPASQAVTSSAASSISGTKATLNGNLTTLGVCPATTEKGFVYSVTGTNSDPLVSGTGVTKTIVSGLSTGAYTLALTGLSTLTGYSFKAYVYDGTTYTYGSVTTFTTLDIASKLAFGTAPPSSGNVGVNLTTFTVQAQRPDNSVDIEYTANITIAKASGSGTLSGTLTAAAVAGVATFSNAQFNAADTYTITATSGALTSVTSGNIVVTIVNASAISWSGASSCVSGSSQTWLTSSNWCGGALPSSTTVAQFGTNGSATTIGFNMNGATSGQKTIGALELISSSGNRTVNNSSTTVSGDMTFSGVNVNSIANVIIRNSTSSSLTITDGSSQTFGVVLGNATNNIINIDGTGSVSISSIISGANPLTKDGVGSGILYLSGVNTYSGGTTINSGTISVNGANRLGATAGNLNINNGTLQLTTTSITSGRNIVLGHANSTIDIATSISYTATTGVISGSGSLNKIGAGTLELQATNTYTGTTFVTAGTLKLNKTGGTTIPNTNNVTINGGTLQISSNQTLNNLTLSSGTLTVDASTTLTINGTYNATGGTINNLGTIIYAGGSVTFPGTGVTINNGTTSTLTNLSIASSGTVTLGAPFTVSGTLTLTSGTFAVGANTLTLNGAAIAGTATNLSTTSSSSLVFGGSASSVAIPSSVTALNNLTINNANGVSLNSNLTVSSTLTVTSGALNVGANTLSISSSTSGSGAINFDNGSTFNFTGGSSITVTNPIALNSGTVIFNYPFGGGADPTFTGDISGSGNMNLTSDVSGRNLLLSGSKSFNGGITLVGTGSAKPNLRINNVGSLGSGTLTSTITVSDGGYLQTLANLSAGVSNNISISGAGHYLNVLADGTNHLLLSGIISGSGIVTKIGSATLTLTGANSYTGLTTVSDGTLQLNRSGGTTIPNTNNVTIGGGTLQVSSNQTLNNLTLTSGTLTVDAGTTLTINGTYNATGGTINNLGTIIYAGGSVTFPGTGVTINNGTASTMANLEIASSGTITLGSSLILSGNLTLTSGTFALGANSLTVAGNISTTTGNIDASSATVILNGSSAQNIAANSFTGNISNLTTNNAAGVTFNSNTTITGTLTLTSGALTFASSTLTMDNGSTVVRATGSLAAAPTYGTGVNVTYTGTTGVTPGFELSPSAGSLGALQITGSGGSYNLDVNRSVTSLTVNSGATIDASTFTITNSGSSTINGTIKTAHASGIAGSISGSAPTLGASSTVEYNSGSAQSVDLTTFANLTLSGAGAKTFAGNTTITKDFAVSGGAVTAPTTISFTGTTAQNLAGISYNNIAFDGVGNKTFTDNASVNSTSALTFNAGQAATIDFDGASNNREFVLSSNSSGTARVANVGSYTLIGNVTAERYVPEKRAWRFVSAPLTTTGNGSIFYNWQNNGSGGAGVEIWATAANGGTATPTSGNSGLALGAGNSLLTYNSATDNFSPVTNTNTTNLLTGSNNNAYCLFITGAFASGNIATGQAATTMRPKGNLRTGNVTINAGTVTAGKFYLVGNPYASPVDPNTLTGTNLSNALYMWDPNANGTFNAGQYVTFNRTTGFYVAPTTSYSNAPVSQIQSGQAFLIQADATAATDITFTEAYKSSTVNNGLFRGLPSGFEQMRITMKKDFGNNNNFIYSDAAVAVFHPTIGQTGIDAYDIIKRNNGTENIALVRATKNWVFEHRPLVTSNDTLFIKLWNTTQANYQFNIEAEEFNVMAGLDAFLIDAYTNTSTPLNLTGITNYNFTVDANTASTGDRFMIVFKPTTTLPVNITSIKATQKATTVVVDWTVENEVNLKEYQVQKSTDGRNFETLATVKANNSKAYSSIDNAPSQGANYYRVVSISNDDKKQYSNIVLVKFGVKNSEVAVYPNPIKGNTINLQLQNIDKGDYELQVINTVGQVVFSKMINHNGGSATQTIQLPGNVAKGNYVLKLANKESILYSEKIILE